MMRFMMILLLAGAAAPVLAQAPEAPPEAPETRSCVENRTIRARDISAANGYFVRTPQGWWRNTGPSCGSYARDRALVTRSTQDRQCRGDVVEVFDTLTRITYGSCILGDWEKTSAPPKN